MGAMRYTETSSNGITSLQLMMVCELQMIDLPENGKVIIPDMDERFESSEYSHIRRRNNTGMIAMDYAIKDDNTILYCLGFDFILDGEISTDNVYKNTVNYGPETHANVSDNYYRIKYLTWFANKNPNVRFVFVVPNGFDNKEIYATNISIMSTDTFLSKLNT
jgi:hypothetical protein